MSSSFTNQTLGPNRALTTGKTRTKVYTLPKHLDEKVARPSLGKIGVKLTKLKKAVTYIRVPAEGGQFKRILSYGSP